MENAENLTAIAAVLNRRSPDTVARLNQYPGLRTILEHRRRLGPELESRESASPTPFLELAEAASSAARDDLDEVLAKLTGRARALARLRLGSGCISTLSAAGLLALLVGKIVSAQVTTAAVGLVSSMLGLVATYVEDYSGGEGSTRRLRELMVNQVKTLAETEGLLRIARVQPDASEIRAILQSLNGILGEVQFARAQLGMPI
jgi:hypothetical protein